MYSVPLELVREIIESIFNDSTSLSACEEPGRTTKPIWSSIESITLASKLYRALAIERWFRTLFIKSSKDLYLMDNLFPEMKRTCARELHCVQLASSDLQVWKLCGFERLAGIRLDWLPQAMMPLYGSQESEALLPLTHVPSTVTELDIRGLPWPSPLIFYNIGKFLPKLEVLRLRQQRIWCCLCHTCSRIRFHAPGPEKIIYKGGLGLPMHYARALCSLPLLHTVCITVADFGLGHSTLADGKGQNENLWAGECDSCMRIMYEDDAFRDRWVARKQGIRSEGGNNEVVYNRPPALRRVEWRFWQAGPGEDLDELEIENESSGSEGN